MLDMKPGTIALTAAATLLLGTIWSAAQDATEEPATPKEKSAVLETVRPSQLFAFPFVSADGRGPLWVGSDTLEECVAAEQNAMREALGANQDQLTNASRVGSCIQLY